MKQLRMRHRGEQDKAPLQYTDCGLDDVYLVSGYEVEEGHHGKSLSIKNIDELHRAIGRYLAGQKKVLSGKELRFLRKQMNLTQSELGKFVGLTSQQVAQWEKEQCEIPGAADLVVRALFLEHSGGQVNLQQLAERIEEADAPMNDKSYFENTGHGWRKAA